MNNTKNIILGDRVLWVALALLSIFSFLPVFSASSNLTYVVGQGTPWSHLLKHFIVLLFGFGLMYGLHKIPYQYFKGISILALPLIILLLIYTASQGNLIAGANANRWIRIPIVGLSFQTSTLASIASIGLCGTSHVQRQPQAVSVKNIYTAPLAPCFSCNITDFTGQFIYLGIVVLYGAHFGLSGWIPHQVPFGDVGHGSVNGPAFCVDCQGLSRLGSQ
jgi:cell division protein FtsW